jgi:hypothetical protein
LGAHQPYNCQQQTMLPIEYHNAPHQSLQATFTPTCTFLQPGGSSVSRLMTYSLRLPSVSPQQCSQTSVTILSSWQRARAWPSPSLHKILTALALRSPQIRSTAHPATCASPSPSRNSSTTNSAAHHHCLYTLLQRHSLHNFYQLFFSHHQPTRTCIRSPLTRRIKTNNV